MLQCTKTVLTAVTLVTRSVYVLSAPLSSHPLMYLFSPHLHLRLLFFIILSFIFFNRFIKGLLLETGEVVPLFTIRYVRSLDHCPPFLSINGRGKSPFNGLKVSVAFLRSNGGR